MAKYTIEPSQMTQTTQTTPPKKLAGQLSTGQKTGLVILGMSPLALGWLLFLGLATLAVYFFYPTPPTNIQAQEQVIPTITPTLPPTHTPTPDYRLELFMLCNSYKYPLDDLSFFEGQYMAGSRLVVLGQFPKGVEGAPIWYQIERKSWLSRGCFVNQELDLPAVSPDLIPPTLTPSPSPTFTPTPSPTSTFTPMPTVTSTPTDFAHVPIQPMQLPSIFSPTVTPSPTPAVVMVAPMPKNSPTGGWCVKLVGAKSVTVQASGDRFEAGDDGSVYLSGQIVGLPVVVEKGDWYYDATFDQCGQWK